MTALVSSELRGQSDDTWIRSRNACAAIHAATDSELCREGTDSRTDPGTILHSFSARTHAHRPPPMTAIPSGHDALPRSLLFSTRGAPRRAGAQSRNPLLR